MTGFGYAQLAAMPEMAEWGYIVLAELEALRTRGRNGLPVIVKRDLLRREPTGREGGLANAP